MNINDRINKKIVELWNSGRYNFWTNISEDINKEFGVSLSGNACRKRFQRHEDKFPNTRKTILEQLEVELAKDNNSSEFPVERDEISHWTNSTIDLYQEAMTPFEQFVEASGVDTEKFNVKQGKIWGSVNSPMFTAAFEPKSLPTYEDVDKLIDRLKHLKQWQPTEPVRQIGKGYTAVFSIFDLHLDQLNHDGTGIEYAKRAYKHVFSKLLEYTRGMFKCDEVVIIVGQDMGNIDNVNHETTKGTPQQNSTTWQIGADEQCDLLVNSVEMLRQFSKVKVIVVPGNHDRLRSYFIGKFLEAWYRNNPNVSIDNGHLPRKYYRFGQVALMVTHGSDEKRSDLPLLFATEGQDTYHDASWREILTGHIHTSRETFMPLDEQKGILIRTLPSLVRPDEWHVINGYVGNNKLGHCDIYSKTGHVARFTADYNGKY